MTCFFYRIRKPKGDWLRWVFIGGGISDLGGESVFKGEPKPWAESHAEAMTFLRKRARRLAKRHIHESVRTQMATN